MADDRTPRRSRRISTSSLSNRSLDTGNRGSKTSSMLYNVLSSKELRDVATSLRSSLDQTNEDHAATKTELENAKRDIAASEKLNEAVITKLNDEKHQARSEADAARREKDELIDTAKRLDADYAEKLKIEEAQALELESMKMELAKWKKSYEDTVEKIKRDTKTKIKDDKEETQRALAQAESYDKQTEDANATISALRALKKRKDAERKKTLDELELLRKELETTTSANDRYLLECQRDANDALRLCQSDARAASIAHDDILEERDAAIRDAEELRRKIERAEMAIGPLQEELSRRSVDRERDIAEISLLRDELERMKRDYEKDLYVCRSDLLRAEGTLKECREEKMAALEDTERAKEQLRVILRTLRELERDNRAVERQREMPFWTKLCTYHYL